VLASENLTPRKATIWVAPGFIKNEKLFTIAAWLSNKSFFISNPELLKNKLR
jgi:hypothetical protein